MKRKIIVVAAVVGTRPTKQMNPAVPYSPEEIAAAAVDCRRAGAACVHLHVRDPETGSPEIHPPERRIALYQEAMSRIREQCDIMIDFSLSKVGLKGPDLNVERIRPVKLVPEIASVSVEPGFFDAAELAMRQYGVKPEMEIYEEKDVEQTLSYIRARSLDKPLLFNLCLGTSRGLQATPENLLMLKNMLPSGSVWSATIVNQSMQMPLIAVAIASGGNVRIGFEDSIFLEENVVAKSNAELVEKVARLTGHLGYEVASPSEARSILGLKNSS